MDGKKPTVERLAPSSYHMELARLAGLSPKTPCDTCPSRDFFHHGSIDTSNIGNAIERRHHGYLRRLDTAAAHTLQSIDQGLTIYPAKSYL